MSTVPSDTVKDLLRQGKTSQAMEVYRGEGATDADISKVDAAAGAVERGDSLEEGVVRILEQPPSSAPSVPAGAPEIVGHPADRPTVKDDAYIGPKVLTTALDRAADGCGVFLLFVVCPLLGLAILGLDLLAFTLLQPGYTGAWGADTVVLSAVPQILFAALGIFLIALPFRVGARWRDSRLTSPYFREFFPHRHHIVGAIKLSDGTNEWSER